MSDLQTYLLSFDADSSDEACWDVLWDTRFARSQDVLSQLADQAQADYQAGRTLALDDCDDE